MGGIQVKGPVMSTTTSTATKSLVCCDLRWCRLLELTDKPSISPIDMPTCELQHLVPMPTDGHDDPRADKALFVVSARQRDPLERGEAEGEQILVMLLCCSSMSCCTLVNCSADGFVYHSVEKLV